MPLAGRDPPARKVIAVCRATEAAGPSHDVVFPPGERSPTRRVPSSGKGSGTVTAVTERTVPKYCVRTYPEVKAAVGDGGGTKR